MCCGQPQPPKTDAICFCTFDSLKIVFFFLTHRIGIVIDLPSRSVDLDYQSVEMIDRTVLLHLTLRIDGESDFHQDALKNLMKIMKNFEEQKVDLNFKLLLLPTYMSPKIYPFQWQGHVDHANATFVHAHRLLVQKICDTFLVLLSSNHFLLLFDIRMVHVVNE